MQFNSIEYIHTVVQTSLPSISKTYYYFDFLKVLIDVRIKTHLSPAFPFYIFHLKKSRTSAVL